MAEETAAADVLAIDAEVARTSGADGYGLTGSGFIPKPFSRVLAEKLALARSLFGPDLDLGSGSAIRKILEVSALEDARTWSALAALYDNQFVATAQSGHNTFDGMCVDCAGNVYAGTSNGVEVYSSTGTYIGTVPTGESSNCTFGGKAMKTLFVTCRSSIYVCRMEAEGHRFAWNPGSYADFQKKFFNATGCAIE